MCVFVCVHVHAHCVPEWRLIIAFNEADLVSFNMIQQTNMDNSVYWEKPILIGVYFETQKGINNQILSFAVARSCALSLSNQIV